MTAGSYAPGVHRRSGSRPRPVVMVPVVVVALLPLAAPRLAAGLRKSEGGPFVFTGPSPRSELLAHPVSASTAPTRSRTPPTGLSAGPCCFYATDDDQATAAAERLITAAGFDPVKAGGVSDAARIEVPGGDLHQNGGLGGRLLDTGQARAAVAAAG